MSAYDQIFHGNFYYWQQSFEKKNRPPHFNFHDHNYFQTSVKLTLDEEMAWLIT